MAITMRQAQLIYAQEVVKQLVLQGPRFSAFTRNYSQDASQVGNKIKVPFVVQNQAAAWSDTTNNYAVGGTDQKEFEIPIDKRYKASFSITQDMLMNYRVDEWREKAELNVAAVINQIFADTVGLVTSANFLLNKTFAGATITLDDIVALRAYCAVNKIEPNSASLVLDSVKAGSTWKYGSLEGVRISRTRTLARISATVTLWGTTT